LTSADRRKTVDRGDVWRRLRDDTRPLAELARQKGWGADEPWRGKLVRSSQFTVLQERALKTLTQGTCPSCGRVRS
jgi:hypothetical protein